MRNLLCVVALVLATGCEDEADRINNVVALGGNPDAGLPVYQTNCSGCHAVDLSGGTGADLRERIPNLSEPEVIERVLFGVDGTLMAGWDGRIADQQIADVAAWLKAQDYDSL